MIGTFPAHTFGIIKTLDIATFGIIKSLDIRWSKDMPNPSANAKFLLELAEKGRSLHPHIPKQYSDRIGLLWAICRECHQPLLFTCELESVPKRGELAIASSGTGICWFSLRKLKQEKPSGLARLRLLYYFAPILGEDKLKIFSDLLLRG